MKVAVFLSLFGVSLAASATAQVPQWTAELTAGAGRHTNRAGTAWYFDGPDGVLRVGVAYRVAGGPTQALVAKVDYLTDGNFGEKLSCTVTPTGGCYSNFRSGHGASIALGVRTNLATLLSLGAAAGIGQNRNSSGGDGVRPYVEGDVAVLLFPHVAVMGLGRYVRLSTNGTSYWFAPLMVGLQVRS